MKNEPQEEKPQELAVMPQDPQALDKPQKDTAFAHQAAKVLMDIVKTNNWSRKLGGQSEHLQYEAWQTVGKYYGYTVKTHDAEYVELGGIAGFKAKATVVNELTGIVVGGCEAFCMKDEPNWKNKPTFQLASMAQTRAGSKALRQILGFVVALAGYNPTPSEEMEGVEPFKPSQMREQKEAKEETVTGDGHDMTLPQKELIVKLSKQKHKTDAALNATAQSNFGVNWEDMTKKQASEFIAKLMNVSEKRGSSTDELVDPDQAEEGIRAMRSIN